MRYVESSRWVGFEEKPEWHMPAALFLAIAFLGLSLVNRASTTSVSSPEAREPARAFPVAMSPSAPHPVALPQIPVPAAPAQLPPVVEVLSPGEEAELWVPVGEAVQSHGLLAALLSLESEGDTTETSEGLEQIASPAAVRHEILAAGPHALPSERLPRMDSVRMLVASADGPATDE